MPAPRTFSALSSEKDDTSNNSSDDAPNYSFLTMKRTSKQSHRFRSSSSDRRSRQNHIYHSSDSDRRHSVQLRSSSSDELSNSTASDNNKPSSRHSTTFVPPPTAWQPYRVWQQSLSDLNAESIPGTPGPPQSLLTPAASVHHLPDTRDSQGPSPLGVVSNPCYRFDAALLTLRTEKRRIFPTLVSAGSRDVPRERLGAAGCHCPTPRQRRL